MTQHIQKMFDDIAPRYDLLNRLLSLNIDRLWRRQAIRLLSGRTRVLDLCTGTLDLTIMLARMSPQTTIDAVDFSQEMLDYGTQKLTAELQQRIHTQCADVQELPYPNNRFDGAMVAYGMRNVDDNQRALTEILRVLKPDGQLVILDFFKPTHLAGRLFHATYGRFVVPLFGGLVSGNRHAYRYLRDSVKKFYTIADYESLMNRCGFKNVSYKHQWGGASTLIMGIK